MTGSPFSLYRRKQSGVWYARFRLPDGSWSGARTTREYKKTNAINFCKEYLRTIGQPVRKQRITFAEFTEGFFDHGGCWERSIAAHHGDVTTTHLKNQKARLKNYLTPVFGHRKLDEISSSDVDRALLYIKENATPGKGSKNTVLSNRTVNSLHSCLSAIFIEAVRQGYMAKNPMNEVPRLRDRTEKRGILTDKELANLINPETVKDVWKSERYYLMFLLAVSTAIRTGELRSLHVEDITEKFIIIRRSIDDNDGERNTTKTGITRTVPLSPALRLRLQAYVKSTNAGPSDYVFPSPVKEGFPIDRDAILRNFRKALERIGITIDVQKKRNLVYHGLRHAAATLAISRGVSPWLVRQMTGHKSDKVFQHYVDHKEGADWRELSEWQERLLEGNLCMTNSVRIDLMQLSDMSGKCHNSGVNR